MASLEAKRFDSPDETQTPDKTKVEIVNVGGRSVGKFTFEPGWSWRECVQPNVGGEWCEVEHIGLVTQGRLKVRHSDGSEAEVGPGDVYYVKPGHEGWVVGDEPFVSVEFQGAERYTK